MIPPTNAPEVLVIQITLYKDGTVTTSAHDNPSEPVAPGIAPHLATSMLYRALDAISSAGFTAVPYNPTQRK